MIIGVTGLPCSGGGSFAECLVSAGFKHLSYSGILREELKKQGLDVTRVAMQNLGNEIRARYGGGELSRRLLAKMEPGFSYVLTTIRNPEEVEVLRGTGKFILIHVDAPREERYKRMSARARESDPLKYEDFIALENKELGKDQEQHGLRMEDCFKMADFTIVNDSSFEELKRKVDELLTSFGAKI